MATNAKADQVKFTSSGSKSGPTYRKRKGYNQAIVTLTDSVTKQRKDYWLGEFNSRESREMYHRKIAEWEALGRRLPITSANGGRNISLTTFNEVVLAYWKYATTYYDPRALGHIKAAVKVTRQFYGTLPAIEFGPNCLRMVREAMIKGDPNLDPPRKPWSRKYINSQVHRLCRIFKWAASYQMMPISVFHELKALPALRRGKTDALETEAVRAVPIETVEAVKPLLSRQVRALVDLQLLTGARGCELFKLRAIDIQMNDKSGIWTVTPDHHKTAHHGHTRTIYFGPKAQKVIRGFLVGRAVDAYLFFAS